MQTIMQTKGAFVRNFYQAEQNTTNVFEVTHLYAGRVTRKG